MSGGTAIGTVQQVQYVQDLGVQPSVTDALLELEEAASVGGNNDLRPGGGDILHFLVENESGEVRMGDVVDSCAAATAI